MSVRVIARIRPLLNAEVEKDQILSIHNVNDNSPQVVKIPNPKNFSEEYSFQFNSVYGQECTQQELFETEVAPSLKHLFQGFDVTLFAYGVTGTGKTHTMRGGKSMADRGMIPRMLSNIYRKSRALEKSSNGETSVDVSMSYYEIYNDKVFDLFEAPEKRTPTGLPIREAEGGKTVVAGLSEVPCSTLKDFEILYDKANAHRSVGATKLNAQSSRSHAILCVKITIHTATEMRSSTISAIDLAGSEDNRRTGNVKDRMVESASINKSLFVLAQCVEAISKKQARIPYRESKMTRILSLGQNNGLTIMILNLAPTKSFHLDTLSSLNFANRTKKIEVREIENEPIFKGPPRTQAVVPTSGGMARQPLRPLNNATNINILANRDAKVDKEKPAKLFSVYADKSKSTVSNASIRQLPLKAISPKRSATDAPVPQANKKIKLSSSTTAGSMLRRGGLPETQAITEATLESLVEKKVAEILAQRELDAIKQPTAGNEKHKTISAEVQARLDSIEKRLEGQDGERAEGLSYLFMAKQYQAQGEISNALKMYEQAQPFFPGNDKLARKIEKLKASVKGLQTSNDSLETARNQEHETLDHYKQPNPAIRKRQRHRRTLDITEDMDVIQGDESYQPETMDSETSYHDNDDYQSDENASDSSNSKNRHRNVKKHRPVKRVKKSRRSSILQTEDEINCVDDGSGKSMSLVLTPRTKYLIDVLNSRNANRLKALNGLGVKKAEAIADHLEESEVMISSWKDVLSLDIRGIGKKSWETMREGIIV